MAQMIGIDVGTYEIKLAELQLKMSGGHEMKQVGSVYNPVGQFLPSEQGNFQKLAVAVKQLTQEYKLSGKGVYVAMPESMAYSSIISLPYLSDAELASSIHWEAEQHIPVSLDEVNLEYEVLYKPKKSEIGEKMRVLLVAAKKEVISRVVELFQLSGVEVIGLETQMFSVHRALAHSIVDEMGMMFLHMGATTTDLMILDRGNIVLTYAIQSGGLALTRAIERGLGLPPSQAEEYKRAYGLDDQQLEGKVKKVLDPVMKMIVGEIRKAAQYYMSVQGRSPIRTILISGGSAYLPSLSGYLSELLSTEVILANPLGGVKVADGWKAPSNIASYTTAIGLAMHDDEE